MKNVKYLLIVFASIMGAAGLSLLPAKAQARDYSSSYNYNYNERYDNYFGRDYQRNFGRYQDSYNRYFSRFSNVTYPRTVYLVDATNSANQLNIINARTGGSTVSARIVVSPRVYNQVVRDYNRLAVVSVSVDRRSDMVTFRTVNGTYSARMISASFQ